MSFREILHETALKAPSSSGVYMWRDPQDTVIYTGDGNSFELHMEANEIKWYEMEAMVK